MSSDSTADAERIAIEEGVRALNDEKWTASEQLDADRMFASFSDAYGVGFISLGVFFPSLDPFIAYFRDIFSRRREQAIDVRETRVSVLAPNVAVLTVQLSLSATDNEGHRFRSPIATTLVCAKVGDDWKVVHAHESIPFPGD